MILQAVIEIRNLFELKWCI